MVYTTYLWWFCGWFIIVSTTLIDVRIFIDHDYWMGWFQHFADEIGVFHIFLGKATVNGHLPSSLTGPDLSRCGLRRLWEWPRGAKDGELFMGKSSKNQGIFISHSWFLTYFHRGYWLIPFSDMFIDFLCLIRGLLWEWLKSGAFMWPSQWLLAPLVLWGNDARAFSPGIIGPGQFQQQFSWTLGECHIFRHFHGTWSAEASQFPSVQTVAFFRCWGPCWDKSSESRRWWTWRCGKAELPQWPGFHRVSRNGESPTTENPI